MHSKFLRLTWQLASSVGSLKGHHRYAPQRHCGCRIRSLKVASDDESLTPKSQ